MAGVDGGGGQQSALIRTGRTSSRSLTRQRGERTPRWPVAGRSTRQGEGASGCFSAAGRAAVMGGRAPFIVTRLAGVEECRGLGQRLVRGRTGHGLCHRRPVTLGRQDGRYEWRWSTTSRDSTRDTGRWRTQQTGMHDAEAPSVQIAKGVCPPSPSDSNTRNTES
jgi:hypothetical protein